MPAIVKMIARMRAGELGLGGQKLASKIIEDLCKTCEMEAPAGDEPGRVHHGVHAAGRGVLHDRGGVHRVGAGVARRLSAPRALPPRGSGTTRSALSVARPDLLCLKSERGYCA